MERITITIDDTLLQTVDTLMRVRGYESRSEAVRDMIRDSAMQDTAGQPDASCVAVLSYIYDHGTRSLARRVTETLHTQHDLSISSLHVHLNHESCLQIEVLKGRQDGVRTLAAELTSQRGVRQANLSIMPVEINEHSHDHGAGSVPHTHLRT